jgi:hypothetical protein
MLGLLLRGALGRLGEADDVEAFAFRRMTVRGPLLSSRRRLKTATDGEVSRMALPLRFEALEGRLLLLVPPADGRGARAGGDDGAAYSSVAGASQASSASSGIGRAIR